MASSALSRRPLASKTARGHSSPVSALIDHGAGDGPPQGPSGGVRGALHRRAPLGRAIGVLDGAAEPFGEAGHVGFGRLVAERPAQGVVGVVGPLGCGQDVGQGLADVVEVGDAVPSDVVEELRGTEPLAQDRVRPGGEGRGPTRHEGVRVEERHGQVADVVLGQLEHLGRRWSRSGRAAPELHRHALGAPDVPEVNSSKPERVLGDRGVGGIGEGRPGHRGQQPAVGRRWPGPGPGPRAGHRSGRRPPGPGPRGERKGRGHGRRPARRRRSR